MSTGTWEAGKNCAVKFTVSGGTEQVFQVTDHTWAEQVDAIDITHTGSGGVQALLATILRGDGNVKANFDSSNKFYSATNGIRAGNSGLLKFYVNATLFYAVPCLIKKVNHAAPVAGQVEFDFDVSLNSEAGAYAYPA